MNYFSFRLRQYACTSLMELCSVSPSLFPSPHPLHNVMVVGETDLHGIGEHIDLEVSTEPL